MPKRIFKAIGRSKTYAWMNANPVVTTTAFVGFFLMVVLSVVVIVDNQNDKKTDDIAICNQELISVFLTLLDKDAKFYENAEQIFTQQAGEEEFNRVESALHSWNELYKDLTNKNPDIISTKCQGFVQEKIEEAIKLKSIFFLGSDPTPNCATHNEYDNIQSFMYPWRVAEIIGNDGWLIDANSERFTRGYRSCWAPGERMVKIWFEQDSNFSYDKAVIDV